MERELDIDEVLTVILNYLGTESDVDSDTHEAREEVLARVTTAMAEYPDNARIQAAAALGAILVESTLIDLVEFQDILSNLRKVPGLSSIEDVRYVGLGPRGERAISLRHELPSTKEVELTEEDRMAIRSFVELNMDLDPESPPDDFRGGMNP